MLIEADLENYSLNSLYELLANKIEEFKAVKNLYGNYQEQQSEIDLIQKVINAKKIKPINNQLTPP